MKITFDDILNSMKQAFFDECGHNSDSYGDITARFRAVASELYSMCCNIDYVKRQGFVQTASGEYLDYHAQLRDMTRKSASNATGLLRFYITNPIAEDIPINAGTICSAKDKPFIQFVTTEDATLTAGTVSVEVNASALEPGDGYNVQAGEVTVLVNAPSRIEGVINDYPFFGGYDIEGDEELRTRLLNSFKRLPNGVSKQYIEDMVCSIDEVKDCSIIGIDPIAMSANVCVKLVVDGLDAQIRLKMIDKLLPLDLIGFNYEFVLAQNKEFDLKIISNADSSELMNLTKEYVEALRIGQALDLVSLRVWLSKKLDADVFDISSEDMSGIYILCANNECLKLRDIEVIPNGQI